MINWKIAGTWQNWIIVFLMFAIGITGVHLIWQYFEQVTGAKDGDE